MSHSDASYIERIEQQRAQKEHYFAEHPHSPVPEGFAGLAYYPVDEAYRVVTPLHEHDEVETLTVETTGEAPQRYDRVGEFRIDIDGEPVVIQAYRPTTGDERLWVPFRDATSGDETYGAGRYIDLDPEEHWTAEGWVLDFNQAYNPTCAYNHAYACPLTPSENWLSVPIRAGEKDYPGEPVAPRGNH